MRNEQWNAELFESWGEVMGRMHRLTKDYHLPNPAWKRQEWYEEDALKLEKYLTPSDTLVREKTEQLLARLHRLPKDRDSYGLVHFDFHQGNFFVDGNGRMTVFDFDDSAYSWFACDIAITLFYVLWRNFSAGDERKAAAERFLEPFMRGYNRENRLDPCWADHMQDFLKLRRSLLVVVFTMSFDLNNLDEKIQKQYDDLKHGAGQDTPVAEIDFTQFIR